MVTMAAQYWGEKVTLRCCFLVIYIAICKQFTRWLILNLNMIYVTNIKLVKNSKERSCYIFEDVTHVKINIINESDYTAQTISHLHGVYAILVIIRGFMKVPFRADFICVETHLNKTLTDIFATKSSFSGFFSCT